MTFLPVTPESLKWNLSVNTATILIHNEKRLEVLHEQDVTYRRETSKEILWSLTYFKTRLLSQRIRLLSNAPNANNGLEFVDETQHFASGLHDPQTLASSWSTSENLALTLPKNKLGCLRFSRL